MVCGHGSRGGSTLAPHNLIRIAAVAATRARHSDWAGQVTDLPSIRGNWSKDHDGHWIGRAGQRFGRQRRHRQLRFYRGFKAHDDEKDFKTDDGHQADNKEGIWTHSIKFSSLVVTTVDTVRILRNSPLTLTKAMPRADPPIDLTELRLFYSAAAATGSRLRQQLRRPPPDVRSVGHPASDRRSYRKRQRRLRVPHPDRSLPA